MKAIKRSAVFSAVEQSPNKVAKLSRMWSVVVVAVVSCLSEPSGSGVRFRKRDGG